jgi:cell shape-determining protein MreC
VPGGLLIGRVEAEPEKNPQGDAQTMKVLPLVEYAELSVVTVVLRADGA